MEVVNFETRGDADQNSKLLPHGGKGGTFVAEIRQAVIAGDLHAAVHSLKDMPGNEDTPGLAIRATLARDPPNDALVLRDGISIDDLRHSKGKGFNVGTNAVRRAAYARRLFPEIEVIHYRGAADTRVRKLDQREMQGLLGGGAVGPAGAARLSGRDPGATCAPDQRDDADNEANDIIRIGRKQSCFVCRFDQRFAVVKKPSPVVV